MQTFEPLQSFEPHWNPIFNIFISKRPENGYFKSKTASFCTDFFTQKSKFSEVLVMMQILKRGYYGLFCFATRYVFMCE